VKQQHPNLVAGDRDTPRWNARSLAAACVFCGFLAVQVVVPALRLDSPDISRFGWQMFAKAQPRELFVVHHRTGVVDTVDVSDFLARHRADLELTATLPAHLCSRVPAAQVVAVHALPEDVVTTVPCP
jgi:hypothetical protein